MFVLALSLLLSLRPASAAVQLLYFRAEAQGDNTILVTWATATELNTTGFRLYRAESAAPTDWGSPIAEMASQGDGVTGANYEHRDSNVVAGVRYYYLLRELGGSGTVDHGPANAGINIAAETPTLTPTASATLPGAPTVTATRPAATFTPSPTATAAAPTATRRFTETPVIVVPTSTPTQPTAAQVSPVRAPTRTPLPVARVASPTGGAPRATTVAAARAATPTAALPFQSPLQASPVALTTAAAQTTATATTATLAQQRETATPRPTKEVTPIIFAAEQRATPEVAAAGQSSRSSSMALVIGGSAIGVAGLLVAALLFIRSRRS